MRHMRAVCAILLCGVAVAAKARRGGGRGESALRGATAFVQTGAGLGWTDEHGYCELCMTAVQELQYGSLPSCGGSAKSTSFSACSQVVQSILASAHDVLHLLAYGCHEYNPYRGWQTIRPCPAHAICGRVVNSFDFDKKAHCPVDQHFRFSGAMANHYPQVKNPLLKYAMQQLAAASRSASPVQYPERLARADEHRVVTETPPRIAHAEIDDVSRPGGADAPADALEAGAHGAVVDPAQATAERTSLQPLLADASGSDVAQPGALADDSASSGSSSGSGSGAPGDQVSPMEERGNAPQGLDLARREPTPGQSPPPPPPQSSPSSPSSPPPPPPPPRGAALSVASAPTLEPVPGQTEDIFVSGRTPSEQSALDATENFAREQSMRS